MAFDPAQSMKDIGEKLGIPDLSPDEEGHWELSTDDFSVHVEAVDETGSVFVYSRIGSMPEDPPIELLTHLLQANFFTRETAGATLGVDKFSDSIVLFIRWSQVELDQDSFELRLLDFFEASDLWVRRVESWLDTATGDGEFLETQADPADTVVATIRG